MPKHVALGCMFGSPVAFTVPDLDRTDYLVIIGANPLVSNGSLATAADFPGKLRGAAQARRQARPSSTRPAPAPPNWPTGTSRRDPAPTPRCCSPSCTCCSTRALSTSATVADHVNGVDDVRGARSGLRARGRRRALRRRRRRDPDARPRARRRARPPRSTAESARPRSNSAPWAAGSSTSSTS